MTAAQAYSCFASLVVLLAAAASAEAGPITANVFGTDFATNPGTFGGSRFEGNPTVPLNSLSFGAEGFQGKVFSWLAIMRFGNQADFDANKGTKTEVLAATPFTFSVDLKDDAGHTTTLTFNGHASGTMSYGNPQLDVAFDATTAAGTLGGATVTAAIDTVRHPNVNPAVTFDGGVSIDGPLPIVTDIIATFSVEGLGTDPTDPDPTDPGPKDGPGVPEPGALTLLGLAVGAVALRRVRGSKRGT